VGLDAVQLPTRGSETFLLNGFDAGREQNTERSVDLPDPCSVLGPVTLAGDPDGNRDAEGATTPAQPIQLHPGSTGAGDLSGAMHGWRDPVAKVTISIGDDDSPVSNRQSANRPMEDTISDLRRLILPVTSPRDRLGRGFHR